MEKRPRSLLEKTVQALDLPADALAGLPKVELIGDREVRMENHRGILAYGSEEIHISGGIYVVKISGHDLELRAMTGLEVLITGTVEEIRLT